VIDNSKGLSHTGQISSMEAVSESKRFLSEPSLETMTVAPQVGRSQIAHNSIRCTDSPLPVPWLGAHRVRLPTSALYAVSPMLYCCRFKVGARFDQFSARTPGAASNAFFCKSQNAKRKQNPARLRRSAEENPSINDAGAASRRAFLAIAPRLWHAADVGCIRTNYSLRDRFSVPRHRRRNESDGGCAGDHPRSAARQA
jgi:hypothetical protein